ncbi:chitobiase/beta-hexosaminidase C-terminal domain-containing protein, partial [Acinetobacter baumannii]
TAVGEGGESAKSVEVRAVPYLPITDAPTFSVGTGTYTSAQQVSIHDDVVGARIYYTLDGSLPTLASTPYSGPLMINSSSTLRA